MTTIERETYIAAKHDTRRILREMSDGRLRTIVREGGPDDDVAEMARRILIGRRSAER